MKLIVTIDYWDGTPGKSREVWPDEIHGGQIAMQFSNAAVASITFTRIPDLLKVLEEKP